MTGANQAIKELTDDGYTPINPDHNAISLILADLGKADLSPGEVEELCQTAKVPTARGFVRLDLLPCGCQRIFKGMILGSEQTTDSINITIGGIEGVKPCPKHTELVARVKGVVDCPNDKETHWDRLELERRLGK